DWARIVYEPSVLACESSADLLGELHGETGDRRDLFRAGRAERPDAAEPCEERPLADRPDPGNLGELAGQRAPRAELPVVAVREPVRLVANALEEPQRAARPGQAQRRGAPDKVDLLLTLRQGADRHIRHAHGLERRHRRIELAPAAVDHREVGERRALVQPATEIAGHDLGHGAEVVVAPVALD